MEKTETIFFATFQSGLKKSDRRQHYDSVKSLIDFHNWIEEQRSDIEIKFNSTYTVESINFIQLKTQL